MLQFPYSLLGILNVEAKHFKFQDFTVLPFTASPLDAILNEIDRLFGFGFYYSAMTLSLTLPDVCSSLEIPITDFHERSRKISKRYIAWCKLYVEPNFGLFTAEDCWALRSGIVHNSLSFGHPSSRYDRVIFQPPQGFIVHEILNEGNGGSSEKSLTLNLERFCHLMIAAVQVWYGAKGTDAIVQLNLPDLVRSRPEGIAPHIVGSLVIT